MHSASLLEQGPSCVPLLTGSLLAGHLEALPTIQVWKLDWTGPGQDTYSDCVLGTQAICRSCTNRKG